ncbi:transport and Golgi organization protein 2 homolog [Centruroides vittatus]|uniref:transport and Golgi organization protein 2 homolog n=1 Tax=Centruroides vittatus TaxID=120091 RepID=UPI00350F1AF5
MCLLFVYINTAPGPKGYHLVLINVRDEIYDRPTAKAMFWEKEPNIISGRDLQPGKEGGTWLAMNKNGKISALLNILQPDHEISPNKKGRGFLVVDYVKNNQDGLSYLQEICDHCDEYNGFLLVTLDLRKWTNDVLLSYFTNGSNEKPTSLSSGIHAFGNSHPNKPWQKVAEGRQQFEKIVNEHPTVESREKLLEELFELLMDDRCYPVDKQMKKQGFGKSENFLQKLSAIFVYLPEYCYGSRCHTAIVVDGTGRVDYVERSLKDFTNAKEPDQWSEVRETFYLTSSG